MWVTGTTQTLTDPAGERKTRVRDPMQVLCPGYSQGLHPRVLLPVLQTVHNLAQAATKGQGPSETAGERPGTIQGTQAFFNPEITAARCAGYCSCTLAQRSSSPAPNAGLSKHRKEQSRHHILDSRDESPGSRSRLEPRGLGADLVPGAARAKSHKRHVRGPRDKNTGWEQQWCGALTPPTRSPKRGLGSRAAAQA